MNQLLQKFAAQSGDTNEETFLKKLILIVAISCAFCGLVWGGLYYWFLGYGITMFLPWVFVLVVGILAIPIAHITKKYQILVFAQLICIMWVPASIQWSLGSMHDSGIVIAWGILGPIGALLFLDKKHAIIGMIQYLFIIIISVTIEPKFSNDAASASNLFRNTFYLINLGASSIVAVGASFYFVTDIIRQRNVNFSLLKETEKKNEEILDSISYAKRIQKAILPADSQVKELIPSGFVLYKPKDIIAGDFYWLDNEKNDLFLAACDCTGHGVPGAMVSVVCNTALHRSVHEFDLRVPGEILDKTRELVLKEFFSTENEVKDGMDIALIRIDGRSLCFSGANNPLWIVRNDTQELEEIRGDRQPVGYSYAPTPFQTHEVKLNQGDCIYLFTDGYTDQFGGAKGKKLKAKPFKDLILSIYQKPMGQQKKIIDNAFKKWKGDLEQVDDICVIGLRVQ